MSRRMKFCKLTLALLLIANGLFAQNKGGIKGIVKTSDGKPASYVNVTLKNTNKGVSTDADGKYQLRNVEAGSHVLQISFIGLETKEQSVEVTAGQITVVPEIVLAEDQKALNEIVITGYRTNPFDKKQSEYVSKMPLKNIENPQVYTSVSAELLKDQVVTNFNDALKNVPGLDKRWESTGRGGDGAGYFTIRGFAVQPTLINGLPGIMSGSLDPANVEAIEVVKGPSGTLYGSSLISYGGLINISTKKPYQTFGGEVSYNTGSFGLNRITADVNTPLGEEKKVALRINTAYHTENSFQDAGFKRSLFIAPALSYHVNDRLSFLVNTEFYNGEGTNPTMLFLNRYTKLVTPDLASLHYNNKHSYTNNDITIKTPSFTLQAQMRYKLSDRWTSQTVLSRSSARSEGYYTYLWDFADGTYGRYFNKQNAVVLTSDIQQNFIGDFEVAGLRNRLVAGLDFFTRSLTDNSTDYTLYDIITIGKTDSSSISQPALDKTLADLEAPRTITREEFYAAYVSDVINLTPALSAMLSLRLDHFRNKGTYDAKSDITTDVHHQTTLSPKFGLMYQVVTDKIALFGNYMNGFTNKAPTSVGGVTYTFTPEHANQWEAGVKTDLFDGRLVTVLSYYDIRVSNVVRSGSVPDGDTVKLGYYQDGSNYSKGIEASVIASPLPGLNVVAGYTYNDSKVTKTDEGGDFEGLRPEDAGPKHLANAWISYRLRAGALKGFGLGFGGNYIGEYATLNRRSTGAFMLPSYTILNSAVSYDTESFRISLKVDNLTNKEYYSGWSTINPQKPRSVTANVTFKF